VIVCTNLACAGAYALMVPLLRDHVGLPAGRVGAILAAGELSALAAAVFAVPLSRRFGPGRVFAAGLILSPIGIAALALATGFGTAVAAAIPFMLLQSVLAILAIGERQRRVPARLQGRAGIAGRMAGLGSVAAGSALASALSGPLGLSHLYLAMAAAALAVALVSTPFLLSLRD
jgi:MFS family permease